MKFEIAGHWARSTIRLPALNLVALIIGLLALGGCGGSSSDSDDEAEAEEVALSLGNAVKDVRLRAGKRTEIKFTYDVPGSITSQGDFSVDLAKTLGNATLSANPQPRGRNLAAMLGLLAKALLKEAFAAETASVTAYLSYSGDPDVCSSSIAYGPYSISGTIGSALTSPTETVSPNQRTIDILNSGSLEVCLVTTPPIDAYANVSAIEGRVEPCAEPTVDIDGSSWSGSFECNNFGTADNPPGSPISLSIKRKANGGYRYVADDGAIYDGHLCANKFRFNGGKDGEYKESGTLVFSNENTAKKTSTWQGLGAGLQGGNCKDSLTRN